MKRIKYIIKHLDDLLSVTKELGIEDKQQHFVLTELQNKIDKCEISLVFSKVLNRVVVSIDYVHNKYPEITGSVTFLFQYLKNPAYFNDFKYKIELHSKKDEEEIVSFLKDHNFLFNNNDYIEGKRKFVMFGRFKAYAGDRYIYNFSSDEYLFERADDFLKNSLQNFKDKLFLMDFLDIPI